MPSITFDKFDVGLDRRKNASVAEANRLRELKNAYVTTGKVLRKRPGLTLVATLEAGTVGLVSGNGVLNTFQAYGGGVSHADTRFLANELIHTTSAAYGGGDLSKIHYGDVFSGYLYVAAEYTDGEVFHYYIDGSDPNYISGAPQSKIVTKQKSRLYSANGDVVDYCVLEDPTDWTTTTSADADSGFLPVGLKARGSSQCLALGQYDGRLAAFFVDSMQVWNIDEAATNNAFYKNVNGVGTRFAKSPVQFAGDLVFLAKSGFRSVTTQSYTLNLTDSDVGSPIDALVKAEVTDALDPIGEYFSGMNQYWCLYPIVAEGVTRVWAYTYSKSSKVAAWSKFEIPFMVDDATAHDGYLYLRSGDNVYRVDETDSVFSDNGTAFDMSIEFPFLNFKSPGVDKYISAADFIIDGTVDVQFRYDPNDETKITDPITVTGNTTALQSLPIEITSPAIAPVFTSSSTEAVQIDAFTFYYENLGAF